MRRMCNYTSNGDDHVFASFASSLSLFNMMQSIDFPNPFKRFTSKTIDSYRCRRVNLCWCGPNGDKSGDEVSISVPLSKTADDDLLRWWSRLSYPAYIPSSMLEGSPPSVCHSFTDDILLVPSPWPSPICVQALPWLRSKAANTSNWRETQEQDIPKTLPTTPKQEIFSQTHWLRSYFCSCLHPQNSCANNLQATLKVKPPRIIASLNSLIAPDYTYRSLPLSKAFNRCTNSWLAPQPAVTNKVGGFELRT